MKRLYVVLLLVALLGVVACEGEEGPAGPAGVPGIITGSFSISESEVVNDAGLFR